MLVRLGSGVSGVLSTCCNLHLCVIMAFVFEFKADKFTHALMITGLRSLMLFNVFGLLFLILASYSSLETGALIK